MKMNFKITNLFFALGLFSSVTIISTVESLAQTTISRPWLEEFQATGGVPSNLSTTGTWEAGTDPNYPGNPGAFLTTGHWPSASLPANSSLQTPNISGILASDSFSFDYVHNSGFPTPGPSSVGAAYFKLYISTNSGATYTQIDSVMSSSNANWQAKKYSLASYAGQTVRFKIESTGLLTTTLQTLRFDNFKVNGTPSTTPCTPPVVDLGPDTILCNGNTLSLDAGNSGASFEWNNSTTSQTLNVSAAGTYWVTVTTGPNCSATDTIVITGMDTPIIAANDISITGSFPTYTFSIVNPQSDVAYTWNFCDGNNATGAQVTHTFLDTIACDISLTVTNICGATTIITILTHEMTNIANVELLRQISVYPNPAKHTVFIKNENTATLIEKVRVIDMLGKVVLESEFGTGYDLELNLGNLTSGIYQLAMQSDKGIAIKQISIVK